MIDRESITGISADVTCPAVLIHGACDQAFSHEDMAGLAARLSGPTEFHTVADATHAVNITHPTQVNAILTDSLSGLVESGA